jgi:hypothetical protein
MITNIRHNLDLSVINENEFSNINILDDRDNVHFCYQNVPFRFSVGQIKASDRAEVIYCLLDKRVDSEEDIDFYWTELTYNLAKLDFIYLAIMFPNIWEFHSEIVENDEKSITFYAYMLETEKIEIKHYSFMEKEDIKVYYLAKPEIEHQKVKLVFRKNAYQIFEGLVDIKMNFLVSSGYTYASIESENVFLADQQKDVDKWLELIQLTPTTEENYNLFFDIEFSVLVLENRIALFQIGNFTFQYEF